MGLFQCFSSFIVFRPDTNHVQSRTSITSEPSEFSDVDDDDSLGEYEDPETAKFNEDGSFIGRYVPKGNRGVSPGNSYSTSKVQSVL